MGVACPCCLAIEDLDGAGDVWEAPDAAAWTQCRQGGSDPWQIFNVKVVSEALNRCIARLSTGWVPRRGYSEIALPYRLGDHCTRGDQCTCACNGGQKTRGGIILGARGGLGIKTSSGSFVLPRAV